ncbi:MAG TPA: GNAT family N-acetyltransferase [Candidatus Dormibacteraeota bacterium]|nr:GNAT family N-acetyltransferase [Candidatus Dormibacteraeota bacterium]
MVIRPMHPERDLDDYLRVLHEAEPYPRTSDEWWERQRLAPADAFRRFFVGVLDGEVIAIGGLTENDFAANGLQARIVVSVAHRGRGHGGAMAEALDVQVAERRPDTLDASLSDADEQSRAWAERRGFQPHSHTIRSRLDLARYDAAVHRDAVARAEAAGYRFEEPNDLDRLYELFAALVVDVPEPTDPPDREWFRRQTEERPALSRLVACHGDEWAGMVEVAPTGTDGALNAFTGVRPEHRGRGLARALKIIATEATIRQGRAWIETVNHAANGPMLAVNRSLGYRRVSGNLFLRRSGLP